VAKKNIPQLKGYLPEKSEKKAFSTIGIPQSSNFYVHYISLINKL
jgi:hypothetical protein